MKKALHIILFTFLSLLSGCIGAKKGLDVKFKDPSASSSTTTTSDITITSVAVTNNQLVINGTGLGGVTSAKLSRSGVEQSFTIESASATQIIANGAALVTIAVGNVFDLILSDAHGSATFAVSFTLDNHSVDLIKLKTTGATTGQVLKFNGTDWVAASIMDAQIYAGTWDASNNIGGSPDLSSVSSTPGEYYIVSVAGTLGGVSYSVGDWIISNGSSWQKVAASKTAVTSFQGRKGIVTLTPADYVSMRDGVTSKVTGSKIADIADVDLTGIADGKLLKWDATNSKWIVGDDTSGTGTIGLGDLSASAPLSYNSTTGAFSISAATTSAAGSFSSADKTKIDSIPGSGDGLFERFSGTIAMKACSGGEMLVWLAPTGWSCTTGAVALTMGMSRNTTANTAGSALTLQASGATTSATDKNGGSLVLSSGIATGTGSSAIEFKTATASSTGMSDNTPTTKMTILGNGKVGIGTASPDGTMSIKNNVANTYAFNVIRSDDSSSLFTVSQNSPDFSGNLTLQTGSTVKIKLDAYSQYSSYINAGNFGIGTTTPLEKLEVAGNGRIGKAPASLTTVNGAHLSTDTTITVASTTGYPSAGTLLINSEAMTYTGTTATTFTGVTRGALGTTAAALSNGQTVDIYLQTNISTASTTPRLSVLASGKVTVGSGTSSGILYAGSGGRSDNSLGWDGTNAGQFYIGSSKNWFTVDASGLNVKNAGTTIFSVTNSTNTTYAAGNVGIGTITPSNKLSVTPSQYSTGTASQSTSTVTGVGTTWTTAMVGSQFVFANGTSAGTITAFVDSTHLTVSTSQTVSSQAYTISYTGLQVSSTGNVGIGTTSPSGVFSIDKLGTGNGFLNIFKTEIAAGYGGNSGPTIDISNYDGATQYGLNVDNGGSFIIKKKSGSISNVSLNTNGSVINGTGTSINAGNLRIDLTTNNGGYVFRMNESGNVGIGTISPSYRLHVLGSSGATVGYFSDGSATCSITPATAGSVSCSSDERLKKNVKEFSDSLSLENVLKLKTVTYEWKNIKNGRHTGYIAQEVEKVAPEFVKTGDDGYKQVSYSGIIPWITGAIKAFYSEFRALVARVMNLEESHAVIVAENKKLKKENEEIKARLMKIEKILEKSDKSTKP